MKLTFIGATTTVTGSKTLLEIEGDLFLIDAGLYQEGNLQVDLNFEELSFDPKKLSGVIITHAHLDHTGFLPFLFKKGFRGPIFTTTATSKLASLIIQDSARLMSESKSPLYSIEDAMGAISLFKPRPFNESIILGHLQIKFHHAGHILGAAFIELKYKDKSLVFSGDLGRYDDPLIGPPEALMACQNLIMEATYGDRNRTFSNMQEVLIGILREAQAQHKTILVPCFALHRAQLLAHLFQQIFKNYPELKMPLAFNSPLMQEMTKVYLQFSKNFLPKDEVLKSEWSNMHFLNHYWDIEAANKSAGPKIIIASSGMLTGGRIWTHLKDLAENPKTIIFLPGFQAPGTPGHQLANGEKTIYSPEKIPIHINAKVISSDAFSAHADQNDLLHWLESAETKPMRLYLIHGEDAAKKALESLLKKKGFNVASPKKEEKIII